MKNYLGKCAEEFNRVECFAQHQFNFGLKHGRQQHTQREWDRIN